MKTNITLQKKTHSLLHIVRPVEQFARSSNVERDDSENMSFEHYLLTSSSLDAINRLASSMGYATSGRAFSVTGPYGSGKSTLAIFLDGLLAPENSAGWKRAHMLLNKSSSDVAHQISLGRMYLKAEKKGFVRCFATAQREPIIISVIRALDKGATKYFGKYTTKNFAGATKLHKAVESVEKNADIPDVRTVVEIAKSISVKAPLFILIDEFGKNLEQFTDHGSNYGEGSDVFLLQELAEAGMGKKPANIFLITMQHMAFGEYFASTSQYQKREWAKIQGRFEDIPFTNSPTQSRMLISLMLERGSARSASKLIKSWAEDHAHALKKIYVGSEINEKIMADCYPIHPIALLLLPEMSTRYGQHGRSLLSFVTGGSKYAVPQFIEKNVVMPNRLPDMGLDTLYDFFISGYAASKAPSLSVTRTIEINSIIRDAHGLSKIESCILKIIGVLNLTSTSGTIRASPKIIECAANKYSSSEVKQCLKQLESKSIITYRDYVDEYRIWQGTGFDIAGNIDQERHRYSEMPLDEVLQHVLQLEPIIAARHGIKTGTMRIFERRFFDPSRNTKRPKIPHGDYDGLVLYITSKKDAKVVHPSANVPIVEINTSIDLADLSKAAVEAAAIKNILENSKEAKEDWVSRQELWERMMHATAAVEIEFEKAYKDTLEKTYRFKKDVIEISELDDADVVNNSESNAISAAADTAYKHTPIVHNEILNKVKISAQGTRGRTQLINNMILHADKEHLGIEGWGPERTMYEAVLHETGIHQKIGSSWGFNDPTKRKLEHTWFEIKNIFENAKKDRVNLEEVYKILRAPPIGAKSEIIPVYLLAALLKTKDIAIYEHGTYCPRITPVVAERLVKNPNHFDIKYMVPSTKTRVIIKDLATELHLKSGKESRVLDVVSFIVRTVVKLPTHTKQTRRLRPKILAVRDAILEATEPDILVFETLPKILGIKLFDHTRIDKKMSKEYSEKIDGVMIELNQFYPKMMNKIITDMLEISQAKDRLEITNVAKSIKNKVADSKTRAFLTAVSSDTLDKEKWANYVAMSLTDKPPVDWQDEDYRRCTENLLEYGGRIRRLQFLHFKASQKRGRQGHRVAVTYADGQEYMDIVYHDKKSAEAAAAIIKKAVKEMRRGSQMGTDRAAASSLLAALTQALGPVKQKGFK